MVLFVDILLIVVNSVFILWVIRNKINNKWNFLSLLITLFLFLFQCYSFYGFTIDDAFISLRYAQNLVNGYGLVFSTDGSMPVEGYTNFLWVMLESVFFLFNLSKDQILHVVKISGVLFGCASVITMFFLGRMLTGKKETGYIAALFFASVPFFAFWTVGGLETPAFLFFLLLSLYLFIRERKKQKPHYLSPFAFLALSLTRPEGLFFILFVFGYIFIEIAYFTVYKKKSIKKVFINVLPALLIFFIVYGIYFVWRYNFYGYLLPNTFYAKVESISLNVFLSRLSELKIFLLYLVPFFIFIIFYFRKFNTSDNFFIFSGIIVLFLFCFSASREWMPGFRYELPFVAVLMVLFSVFTSLFFHKVRLFYFVIFLLLGIYLVSPGLYLAGKVSYTNNLNRSHVQLGKWLKKFAPPDASYASWDLGAVPYYSDIPRIFDIGHPKSILSAYTTHHPYSIDYFLDHNPSFIVLHPDRGEYEGFAGFHKNEKFLKNYKYIFTLAFSKNYHLAVYQHNDVILTSKAYQNAQEISNMSFDGAYSTSFQSDL